MIVVPIPFDLRLWTGADDNGLAASEAYSRFVERVDVARHLNQLLSRSAIQHCGLRVPLTQPLFEQLSNEPPWSEIRRGSFQHRLKATVLALLRNKRRAAGLTLYLDIGDVAHLYEWEAPDGFFPSTLATMESSWTEMVGICAFEEAVVARGFDDPLPVLKGYIVTSFSEASSARIARRSVVPQGEVAEELDVPLLFQSDLWTWRRRLRQSVWADERLPLGPVGFSPPDWWRLGDRPRRHRNAYLDAMGGLWEWESGRATDDRNPFGGHWNVQLPDDSARTQWARWIEARTGRQVAGQPGLIAHVNVEPDGSIADTTFDWRE